MSEMSMRQLGSDPTCPSCGASLELLSTPYGSTHASTCLVCYGSVNADAPSAPSVPDVPDHVPDLTDPDPAASEES